MSSVHYLGDHIEEGEIEIARQIVEIAKAGQYDGAERQVKRPRSRFKPGEKYGVESRWGKMFHMR
ncbi:hypothetical protein Gmet_3618 [Geobacter metallireducens GS-15]|uniref:Uncharacterized protein n=1 Tax=Geobacter metallireducens (strain ATCC 53774 / DSM 7210 / GS-15) TaxID=269799 RepID=J9JEN8_GEOMG|nr:hypothetical protein Gmet_3618 [Geobacter metallireducens GS-15]